MPRQGDVLIFPATKPVPASAKKLPKPVLAEGEVTGHYHVATTGEVYVDDTPNAVDKWLRATTPTVVRHDEHAPIPLIPDTYVVRRQLEFDPLLQGRMVLD